MTGCLRSQKSSKEGGEQTSLPFTPSYYSCSEENSDDVFLQESAFGSFTSDPGDLSYIFPISPTFTRNKKSSSSSRSPHPSSSSEGSSYSARQGSVKKLLKRSLSFINKSKSEHELYALYESELNQISLTLKESLLHVFRNNTMPEIGLCRFQEMLAALVFSGGGGVCGGNVGERGGGGGGGPVERCWREEVVPEGIRMLAVTVASPKDGDRIVALLTSWDVLYTSTLPLLQALMAPLNSLNVRNDVLGSFRDTVLPYAGMTSALTSEPQRWRKHTWKLRQMLLTLARLSPCRCHLGLFDDIPTTSNVSPSPEVTPQSLSLNLDAGTSPSAWDTHTINEILCVLEKHEDKSTRISAPLLEQILHLHHGGGQDLDSIYLQQISNLQRHEAPLSPGYWLTRNPTTVHTLEELLRSAAAR